jgi:predicted nucleotidyltransferase
MGEGTAPVSLSAGRLPLDPEVQRFLDECLGPIRTAFAPEGLFIFGSRASGTPDEWSDIDILLVSGRFAGRRAMDRLRTFRDLIEPHRHVDVVCVTPEEFERRREGANLVAEAVRTGIRIL